MVMTNIKGEKGSFCFNPFFPLKSSPYFPLMLIVKWTKAIQFSIHFVKRGELKSFQPFTKKVPLHRVKSFVKVHLHKATRRRDFSGVTPYKVLAKE